MRGVRPAALPPPSPVAPPTPVQPGEDETQRSAAFLPPNESSQLPPVLPTIGEGSQVEETPSAPLSEHGQYPSAATNPAKAPYAPRDTEALRNVQQPRQEESDRRSSRYGIIDETPVDMPPMQQQQPPNAAVPAPPVASIPAGTAVSSDERRQPSRGESSNEGPLATYQAFLASDIARERTPPSAAKTVPASAFVRPQPPTAANDQPRPGMIDTKLRSSYYDQAREAPFESHDFAGDARAAHDVGSGRTGAHPPTEQYLAEPSYGTPSSAGRPSLPSPGAPSLRSLNDDRGGSVSPGLPYLADSPEVGRDEKPVGGAIAPPVPTVTGTKTTEAASSEVARSAMVPPAAPAAGAISRMDDPAEQSDRSVGTRVSQAHNGRVVDSPVDLPLESPTDSAFATKPLFAGQPQAPSKDESAPSEAGTVSNLNAAEPQSEIQPAAPTEEPFAVPGRHARLSVPEREQLRESSRTPPLRVETAQQSATPTPRAQEAAQASDRRSKDVGDDPSIHSDLIAAINFVEQSSSPTITTPYTASSVEPSPAMPNQPFQFGPPKHSAFVVPPSPSDEHYGAAETTSGPSVNALAHPPTVPPRNAARRPSAPSELAAGSAPAFPSSFAQNKRDERVAAAQLAQQAQQAALTRPGRAPGTAPRKKKMWEDSDEEEDEPEAEDSDDDESEPAAHRSQPIPPSTSRQRLRPSSSQPQLHPSTSSHSLRGTTRDATPVSHGTSAEMPPPVPRHFSRSPQRAPGYEPGSRQSVYEQGSGAPSIAPSTRNEVPEEVGNRKPALNPHGLLATGILEKEERSARAQEYAARDAGSTLVSLPSKVPPPQTGLVGAITSHQREKERTGGVGRALTEQQKERKLAEQRQKQLDELQKQQLAMVQQQMQMAQFGGGFNPMAMGSMGFGGSNPWMMGGMGGMAPSMAGFGGFPGSQMGAPGGGSPVLQPQHSGDANAAAVSRLPSRFSQVAMCSFSLSCATGCLPTAASHVCRSSRCATGCATGRPAGLPRRDGAILVSRSDVATSRACLDAAHVVDGTDDEHAVRRESVWLRRRTGHPRLSDFYGRFAVRRLHARAHSAAEHEHVRTSVGRHDGSAAER